MQRGINYLTHIQIYRTNYIIKLYGSYLPFTLSFELEKLRELLYRFNPNIVPRYGEIPIPLSFKYFQNNQLNECLEMFFVRKKSKPNI